MTEYEPSVLHEIQETELEILCEVIRICEKHHLEYFSIGGTTLGAMRHDGFIPWDDDIDIGLLRDDYERFLEVAPAELDERYVLQWYRTDRKTPVYFAKVRKNGTRFVELGKEGVDMHHGIFVDVMPFDEIPADEQRVLKYRRWSRVWKEVWIAKSIRKLTMEVPQPMRFAATAFRTVLHAVLAPVSKDWIFKKYDSYLRQHNGIGSRRYSSRGNKAFECDYDDLIPPQPHKFENISIMIPANPEKVLATQYGNWRELPPVEKRRNHAPQELSLGERADGGRKLLRAAD